MTREKPDFDNLDEMLSYLDDLRESGVTNMFGARPYVEEAFDIPAKAAGDVLLYWMETFSERHGLDGKRKL